VWSVEYIITRFAPGLGSGRILLYRVEKSHERAAASFRKGKPDPGMGMINGAPEVVRLQQS
jgi:hypothetical protein